MTSALAVSNKAQHTLGPWSLNTQYADTEVRGPDGSGVLIAVMSPWGIAAEAPSPQAANARLIAAAPELLAFAQLVLRGLMQGTVRASMVIDIDPDAEQCEMRPLSQIAAELVAKATAGSET